MDLSRYNWNVISEYKPKEKEYLLFLIKILIEESGIIIKYNLINLIPVVIELLYDVKEYVRITAKEILIKLMYSCENEDLTSFFLQDFWALILMYFKIHRFFCTIL